MLKHQTTNWENICHKDCKKLIPGLLTWILNRLPPPGLCPCCSLHLLRSPTAREPEEPPSLMGVSGQLAPSRWQSLWPPWFSLFNFLGLLFSMAFTSFKYPSSRIHSVFVSLSSLAWKSLTGRKFSVLFTAVSPASRTTSGTLHSTDPCWLNEEGKLLFIDKASSTTSAPRAGDVHWQHSGASKCLWSTRRNIYYH